MTVRTLKPCCWACWTQPEDSSLPALRRGHIAGRERQHTGFQASGMSPEEAEQLWALPQAMTFFNYLSAVDKPLRLKDFNLHTETIGLTRFEVPLSLDLTFPFIATPVRHQGEVVGIFFWIIRKKARSSLQRTRNPGHVP